MSKITFYIARHGKTLMNTLDMVQGWCDSPLTDEGVEVAKQLGRGLKDVPFRTVYCSTLRRTHQTAQIVIEAKGQKDLAIIEKDGFKECGFGCFEAGPNSLMWEYAALFLQYTSFDEMYQAILKREINYKKILDVIKKLDTMGIAENFADLESRTQAALKEVAEEEIVEDDDANILIISHGMSILGMLYGLGGEELLTGHLDNAAVCKVIYQDGKFMVESMGDMSYVEKGKQI